MGLKCVKYPVVTEINKKKITLFYRFLHLYLVDLDTEQFVFKIIVKIKPVAVLYVFPPRVLVKNTCFSTGQGLKCPSELSVLCEQDQLIVRLSRFFLMTEIVVSHR